MLKEHSKVKYRRSKGILSLYGKRNLAPAQPVTLGWPLIMQDIFTCLRSFVQNILKALSFRPAFGFSIIDRGGKRDVSTTR